MWKEGKWIKDKRKKSSSAGEIKRHESRAIRAKTKDTRRTREECRHRKQRRGVPHPTPRKAAESRAGTTHKNVSSGLRQPRARAHAAAPISADGGGAARFEEKTASTRGARLGRSLVLFF